MYDVNLYYNTCMLHCFIVQLICVQVQSIHDMIIIENCPIIPHGGSGGIRTHAIEMTGASWCGLSPAQLLMERCIRSNIPLPKEEMIPKWKYLQDFRVENQKIKDKQKRDYDRSHRVHELPPLPGNCDVWITSSGQPISGTITSSSDLPRSYYVQTPTGEVRRNQHHLNRVPDSMNQDQPQSSETRRIMTRSRTGTPIIPPDRLLYNL